MARLTGKRPRGRPRKDLTGQRFDSLTVLGLAYRHGSHAYWLCRCDCGETLTVRGDNLATGATSHCGCKRVYTYRSRKPSLVTYNGEEVTVAQLAKRFGIHHSTLAGRLRRGLSVEDAVRKSGGG